MPCVEHPLISIGMPVYNCDRTLQLAIRSLIVQTCSDWELILIDDGSSDETLRIAHQFSDPRIRIFSDGLRRGLPFRLNQAVTMSRGKYFARMDGDDIAYPERLERQINYLKDNPEIDLVGTWMIVFGSAGIPLGKRTDPELHTAICKKPFDRFRISHPTFLGQLEWFRIYRYAESFSRAQDQELLLRSYKFSRFANVPEILLGYREENIYLYKILSGRWAFTCAALRELLRQHKIAAIPFTMIKQGLKAAFDSVAVMTGLNHRLLRHRARQCTDAEKQDWRNIWRLINQDLT